MEICKKDLKYAIDIVPVGDVAYGELILLNDTNLYIKGNKRKMGVQLTPNNIIPNDSLRCMSMLFNPRIGSTRFIPGSTKVKVLKGELTYEEAANSDEVTELLKEFQYKGNWCEN